MLSYLKARLRPDPNPRSFEDWVSNQFGRRLFEIFFKTYTEKVWGISCKEISADWAAQRIKGLSLAKAIKNGLFPQRSTGNRQDTIKTLINTFRYPRKGPGMLWESCARKVTEAGGRIAMGQRMVRCAQDAAGHRWTVTTQSADGRTENFTGEHVISSAPLRELVKSLEPRVSEKARRAAEALRYRDFLTVALMLRDRHGMPDNWIYIHDSRVQVGRIQNYKSWSPEMVPDPACCCYGLEYFCFEGDGLWESSDAELIALATRELAKLGLADAADVFDGCVVRQPKAYPVYDDDYACHVSVVREEIEKNYPGLHMVGRNGMHKYNNQDHAMMTALLTVDNIAAGEALYDVWRVNEDAEYHEDGAAGERSPEPGVRLVPSRVRA
jgi:protoporphyrinogen oxidase